MMFSQKFEDRIVGKSFLHNSSIHQIRPDESSEWEKTSVYWNKFVKNQKFKGIDDLKLMNGQQLYKHGVQLQSDVKNFHKFREKTVLKLMFLHQKRRARLL